MLGYFPFVCCPIFPLWALRPALLRFAGPQYSRVDPSAGPFQGQGSELCSEFRRAIYWQGPRAIYLNSDGLDLPTEFRSEFRRATSIY